MESCSIAEAEIIPKHITTRWSRLCSCSHQLKYMGVLCSRRKTCSHSDRWLFRDPYMRNRANNEIGFSRMSFCWNARRPDTSQHDQLTFCGRGVASSQVPRTDQKPCSLGALTRGSQASACPARHSSEPGMKSTFGTSTIGVVRFLVCNPQSALRNPTLPCRLQP